MCSRLRDDVDVDLMGNNVCLAICVCVRVCVSIYGWLFRLELVSQQLELDIGCLTLSASKFLVYNYVSILYDLSRCSILTYGVHIFIS